MTDVDEHLLTAAKLREQIRGRLDGEDLLHNHAGLIEDRQDRAVLSFLEGTGDFASTSVGKELTATIATDLATEAVQKGNGSVLSHLVGVTEQDLDGSTLRLPLLLVEALENNDAPAFVTAAGNPNSGKTNTMSLLAELRSSTIDEYLILSNIRSWDLTDVVVTSAHDLTCTLLEHRDVPKMVVIDEASTHFDARTYRREVAQQYTPLAKRFAKLHVDCCGLICHTGKDLHPEAKRMTTLAFLKADKKVAEFFSRWPADGDSPTDRLYGGPIESLEPTGVTYDPDDAAPWAWDLEPEPFTLDLDWLDLLRALRSRGPST